MDLIYYTPHKLYSYPDVAAIDPMQVSFSQMFNASISIIDRSGTIQCPPIPVKVMDPMESWNRPRDFDSICYDRYDRILRSTIESGKRLVIFYSGGIDSTLIAALALRHTDFNKHKDHLLLALSEDSIRENPVFWRQHLLPAFGSRIVNASGFHALISDDDNVCLTGEFADNIFGSLTVKSYMDNTGDRDAIHKDFRSTGMGWLLNKITNAAHRDGCVGLMESIFATHPVGCNTNHDCFWWLNFVLKWQAVKMRLISHAPTAELVNLMAHRVVHFFETKEFQDWAVLTDEPKVGKDWFSYKLPAKNLIYSLNGDEYYLKWKTKYPSIPSLTRYANMHDFIYHDTINDRYVASKVLMDRGGH
jgi:hypothetical protein